MGHETTGEILYHGRKRVDMKQREVKLVEAKARGGGVDRGGGVESPLSSVNENVKRPRIGGPCWSDALATRLVCISITVYTALTRR